MIGKVKTFLALMVHFFAVLCIGEVFGEYIVTRQLTWCTWLTGISSLIFIGLYAYLSFNSDIERKDNNTEGE